MGSFRKIVIALGILTAVFTVIIFSKAFQIQSAAGAIILDMRVQGTDVTDAAAFIAALKESGSFQLHTQLRALDLVYPVVYGAFGGAWLYFLYAGSNLRFISALGVVAPIFDYMENHLIEQVVSTDGTIEASLVERMSMFTQIKYGLIIIALIAIGFGVVGKLRDRKG